MWTELSLSHIRTLRSELQVLDVVQSATARFHAIQADLVVVSDAQAAHNRAGGGSGRLSPSAFDSSKQWGFNIPEALVPYKFSLRN